MIDKGLLKIKILGDSGPFSKTGRSISYLIEIDDTAYILDIGSPVFQLLNFQQLNSISGVICTHPHDDHKRWLTDFLLYRKYVTPNQPKLRLLTGYALMDEIRVSSRISLEKTLSPNSEKVVYLAYESFVDETRISPAPKYSIKQITENNSNEYRVINSDGEIVKPDKAKVIVNRINNIPEILFFDEECGKWVNPEIYYSFSDSIFYKKSFPFIDEKSGMKITAVNAGTWHGITAVSIIVEYDNTKIYFSGDTVYNIDLWTKLYKNELTPKADLASSEFLNSYCIKGDLNDYIQLSWSEKRFCEALALYKEMDIIIHDSAAFNSIVHTDFCFCRDFDKNKTMLTHNPDKYISFLPITYNDKQFAVKNKKIYEIADNNLYELNADYYIKMNGKFFAGYKDPNGMHAILTKNGAMDLVEYNNNYGENAERIKLYEDVGGKYYSTETIGAGCIVIDNIPYNRKELDNGNILLEKIENHRRI